MESVFELLQKFLLLNNLLSIFLCDSKEVLLSLGLVRSDVELVHYVFEFIFQLPDDISHH
jgi:hypothetical protein